MEMMDYDEWLDFCEYVGIIIDNPDKHLRTGQQAYVELYERFPEIASALSGTMFDPFYKNNIIPLFLSRLLRGYTRIDYGKSK